MQKMNPEVKALWLEALESGEFEQVQGSLRSPGLLNDYGHCCLGVMCEVYKRVTGEGEWGGSFFTANAGQRHCDGIGTLPPAVREWAGLATQNPKVTIEGVNQSVAEHNDGRNGVSRTFKEIAQAVREQL